MDASSSFARHRGEASKSDYKLVAQGLLEMEAILSLVEHDRVRALGHLLRDLVATARQHPPPQSEYVRRAAVDGIAKFLKEGGRLIACYLLAKALEPVVGILNGAYVLQKCAGHFSSIVSLWQACVKMFCCGGIVSGCRRA